MKLEKTFEVDVPAQAAYEQWMRVEDFPRFMEGVKEVRRIDRTHLHWHASVAGIDKEWDSEITEHKPGRRIAWQSTAGARNAGEVDFEPLDDDRTRVHLIMEYEPENPLEAAGEAMGLASLRMDRIAQDFKQLVEPRA